MLTFRIAHQKYAQDLSVSGLSGRWNSNGKLVLYTSENISLALLENMVYRAGTGFNSNYKIMVIEGPEARAEQMDILYLPKNWRDIDAYSVTQKTGDLWYDRRESLLLKVPSSVLPQNMNVIINTTHADFKDVKLIAVLDYEPDERIENILKKYQ